MNEVRSVLVLNAGSSSLKFAVHSTGSDRPLIAGQIGGIGEKAFLAANGGRHDGPLSPDARHGEAFAFILDWLPRQGHDPSRYDGFGHRIVHGGATYSAPVIVDDKVAGDLDQLKWLAPLHMPAGVDVLARARQAVPNVPQVACFDTAFHATLPDEAGRLPLPRVFHERGYRRYGFHGLNYEHIVAELPGIIGKRPERLIVAHLGQGASMCAIKNGKSIATTMGYSTADGLIMGTRTGALDPGVIVALMRDEQATADDLEDLLYRRSGLLGLSGITGDMRTLLESDVSAAHEAINHYCYSAARHAGSLAAALQGVDAFVFTGGIGENAHAIRARILDRLGWLGLAYDPILNRENARTLSPPEATCSVHVIPANEELAIARHAFRLLA